MNTLYAQYITSSCSSEQVARLERPGKRDVTHILSDAESISHDHLPKSEITTRPPFSREPGIGPGNRRETEKDSETDVKRGK